MTDEELLDTEMFTEKAKFSSLAPVLFNPDCRLPDVG